MKNYRIFFFSPYFAVENEIIFNWWWYWWWWFFLSLFVDKWIMYMRLSNKFVFLFFLIQSYCPINAKARERFKHSSFFILHTDKHSFRMNDFCYFVSMVNGEWWWWWLFSKIVAKFVLYSLYLSILIIHSWNNQKHLQWNPTNVYWIFLFWSFQNIYWDCIFLLRKRKDILMLYMFCVCNKNKWFFMFVFSYSISKIFDLGILCLFFSHQSLKFIVFCFVW